MKTNVEKDEPCHKCIDVKGYLDTFHFENIKNIKI